LYWYPVGSNIKDHNKRHSFIIKGGLAGLGQIPQKIEDGDEWTGLIRENKDYEKCKWMVL